MASNFQGLTNTKRHTRANGISAGADCPGVFVDGIDEDLFGIFRQKFVHRWMVCTVRRIPSVNVGMEIILFCWREEKMGC